MAYTEIQIKRQVKNVDVKKLLQKGNRWLALLLLAEAVFLLVRLAADWHTPAPIVLGPDALMPYADACTKDSRGVRIEDFSGDFATTGWVDLPAGSYQISVTYKNTGGPGRVSFRDEVMPMARYDAAALPAERTRTVFSLWMPYDCETTQLHFWCDGGIMYVTGVQFIPTHGMAYVHFLTVLCLFLLLDGALFVWRGVLPDPCPAPAARYSAVAIAAMVLLACLPLGLDYLPFGHDLSIHLARIEGIKSAMQAGQFPVRLDPALMNDKGYPFSLMYGDILLWPAAVLRLFGFSLQAVYKLYVFAVTLATALLTRWVLRRILGTEPLALAGTALYLLSMYRLGNVYVRAAVGEYSAMLFLPLAVYGFWRLYTLPRDRKAPPWCWVPLALAFTGLLQTHLLTAFIAALFGTVFCLCAWRRTLARPVLPALCKAAGAFLLWDLWFLVPLLQFMAQGVCSISGKFGADYLQIHILMPGQIFLPFAPEGGYSRALAEGLSTEMVLSVGLVLGLLGLLALAVLLDARARAAQPMLARTAGVSLALAVLALWMSSELFPWYDIYRYLPPVSSLFGKLQFPWRFLSPATVFLCVAGICALALVHRSRPQYTAPLLAAALLLTVLPAGQLLYGVCHSSEVVHYRSLASVDSMSGQVGGGEYLPAAWGEEDPWAHNEPEFPDGVTVLNRLRSGDSLTVTLQNGTGAAVTGRLPLLDYPGYRLQSGGAGVSLGQADGFVTLTVPAGWQGTVVVDWAPLWYWRAADIASLLGIAAMAACALRRRQRGQKRQF